MSLSDLFYYDYNAIREPNLLIPNKQPVGPVEVNRKVELYGIPRTLTRLGWHGHPETLSNNSYLGVDEYGQYVTTDTTADEGVVAFSGLGVLEPPFTLLGSIQHVSLTSTLMFLGDPSSWNGWHVNIVGTQMRMSTGITWSHSDLADALTAGLINFVGIVASHSYKQIVVNGRASVPNTDTDTNEPSSTICRLGARYDGSSDTLAKWYQYGVLPYALTEAEAIEWTKDPYQFLKVKA